MASVCRWIDRHHANESERHEQFDSHNQEHAHHHQAPGQLAAQNAVDDRGINRACGAGLLAADPWIHCTSIRPLPASRDISIGSSGIPRIQHYIFTFVMFARGLVRTDHRKLSAALGVVLHRYAFMLRI